MRSGVYAILPLPIRRALRKLGADVALARRKRKLTVGMMAERIGVAKPTYLKVEKGDPRVGVAIYAMTLFVLGLGDAIGDLADPRADDHGLLMDFTRLPKRVRVKLEPTSK